MAPEKKYSSLCCAVTADFVTSNINNDNVLNEYVPATNNIDAILSNPCEYKVVNNNTTMCEWMSVQCGEKYICTTSRVYTDALLHTNNKEIWCVNNCVDAVYKVREGGKIIDEVKDTTLKNEILQLVIQLHYTCESCQ